MKPRGLLLAAATALLLGNTALCSAGGCRIADKLDEILAQAGIKPGDPAYKAKLDQFIASVNNQKNWTAKDRIDGINHLQDLKSKAPTSGVTAGRSEKASSSGSRNDSTAATGNRPRPENRTESEKFRAPTAYEPAYRLFDIVRRARILKKGDMVHATTKTGLRGMLKSGKINQSRGKYGDYGDGVYVQTISGKDLALIEEGTHNGLYSLTLHGRAVARQIHSEPVLLRIVGIRADKVGLPNGDVITSDVPIKFVQVFDPVSKAWVAASKYRF